MGLLLKTGTRIGGKLPVPLFRKLATASSHRLIGDVCDFTTVDASIKLTIPDPFISEILVDCVKEGLILGYVSDKKEDSWMFTPKGLQMVKAGIGNPISRKDAESRIGKLVQIAEEANSNAAGRMFVNAIAVFGSVLTNKEALGDLDVAIDMVYRDKNDPDIRHSYDILIYRLPSEEKTLRSRFKKVGRRTNIIEMAELRGLKVPYRVVYLKPGFEVPPSPDEKGTAATDRDERQAEFEKRKAVTGATESWCPASVKNPRYVRDYPEPEQKSMAHSRMKGYLMEHDLRQLHLMVSGRADPYATKCHPQFVISEYASIQAYFLIHTELGRRIAERYKPKPGALDLVKYGKTAIHAY